jgi:SNF2 family DNA or RNA helicase
MRAFKCVRIDGSISSSSERQSRIASFNADPSIDVFLLTTQCGGVGITLNGADRVIIFDPAWNPAVDAQVARDGEGCFPLVCDIGVCRPWIAAIAWGKSATL